MTNDLINNTQNDESVVVENQVVQNWYSPTQDQHPQSSDSLEFSGWRFLPAFFDHRTRAIELALLKLIRSSIKNQLPIGPVVEVFAHENRAFARARIQKFAAFLNSNLTLSQSVEKSPKLFAPDSILAIQVASEFNNIERTIDCLIQQKEHNLKRSSHRLNFNYVYWILILAILLYFANFIWPTMLKLVNEFEIQSTPGFDLTNHLFTRTLRDPFLGWLIVLLTILSAGFWLSDTPYFRRRILTFDAANGISAGQHFESLFQILAGQLRFGQSLDDSVQYLTQIHPNPLLRRKLQHLNNLLKESSSPWNAFFDANLVTSAERDSLLALEKAGPHSNILQALILEAKAEAISNRTEHRISRWLLFLQTTALLLLGGIVFLICYSLFEMLITLITSLSVPNEN